MALGNLFDIEKTAREAKLDLAEINALKKEIRKEFPDDELMYELHLVRAIKTLFENADTGMNHGVNGKFRRG